MPTNLPPEYFNIEAQYRSAQTPEEKIAHLEDMLSVIPKHKGTDKLRGDLRKRLSKLKSAAQARKKVGKRDSTYIIDKEGAGQVAVIGPANVGKSALVTKLTNASPEVAAFPFTTWKPTPGMMEVDKVQIQLIDTPPLDRDYIEPELIDLIRRADLVLVLVDVKMDPITQLEKTIALLESHRIYPLQREAQFSDQRRPTFMPFLIVANKCDDENAQENFDIFCEFVEEDWNLIPLSVSTGLNLDQLKQSIFDSLNIVRIYAKPPGAEPDLETPFVLDKGSTVQEFAVKVHQDFYRNLKSARVWGKVEFDGQMVSRDHVLSDGDIVELQM